MAEKHWAMIWHQAMTGSFLKGKAFGWNKTIIFSIPSPVSGDMLRLSFSNCLGSAPYEIGALKVCVNGTSVPVTLHEQEYFQIPAGGTVFSDPCRLAVKRGDDIEIRMYYTNAILESNMIEEEANLLKGDYTDDTVPMKRKKPLLAKALGAYNAIPAIEAVEILSEEPAKAIVAFGDSITALSRWTKPLSRRLAETYPGEYVLLNSGISGNCLLYEPEGIFASVFGSKGTDRFRRDVLEIPGLDTVIFGLGVNDVSYLNETTVSFINLNTYQSALTKMSEELHQHGVRMVMQTITPRLGVSRTMGKYTAEMEALRLSFNDWIRNTDIFDYVFDAEVLVREKHEDGWYFREGLHQGDRLHPNERGGQLLADAFDLSKLTGRV